MKTTLTLLAAMLMGMGMMGCNGNAAKSSIDNQADATEQAGNSTSTAGDSIAQVGNADDLASADQESMAPDFTLKDINGQQFTLSSLRGKYVVLDFWGSWCPWCLRGLPRMKEYYQKYKNRMEIVGIDCQETEEDWRACVKENQIPWLHVYNPTDDDSLQQAYALEGYPHKVVISPEGRILRTFIGEVPEFYSYLDELLGS